jgi:hypothetical protein
MKKKKIEKGRKQESEKENGRGCGKRKKLIVGVRWHGKKTATSPGTCPEVRWGF